MPTTYPPPVDQLLTLGEPKLTDQWLDYRARGLGDEHVPVLIQMLQDPELDWAVHREGDDETPFWARVHAWRALGQLRAGEAAEALVGALVGDDEDEWAAEEIPEVLEMIGPTALPPLRTALPLTARKAEFLAVGSVGEALRRMAAAYPEVRDEVVALLTRQLRSWAEQDRTANAFLISDLLELRAVEVAPVMQEALEAGAVDEDIVGDWEDVQVALGLLARRTTPRPRSNFWPTLPLRDEEPERARPAQRSTKASAKTRNRRKAAKQSRKKNRRRK
jgi:hypothetical protein